MRNTSSDFFPAACKRKELHRDGSGSLRYSSTREIIKGQPLKPGKHSLAMQITFREMVAVWGAVFWLVAHEKEITAPFIGTSVDLFSLRDMTFKSCGDLEVTALLVICLKLVLVLFFPSIIPQLGNVIYVLKSAGKCLSVLGCIICLFLYSPFPVKPYLQISSLPKFSAICWVWNCIIQTRTGSYFRDNEVCPHQNMIKPNEFVSCHSAFHTPGEGSHQEFNSILQLTKTCSTTGFWFIFTGFYRPSGILRHLCSCTVSSLQWGFCVLSPGLQRWACGSIEKRLQGLLSDNCHIFLFSNI